MLDVPGGDALYGASKATSDFDDISLVSRLAVAHRRSVADFSGHGASFWAQFAVMSPEIDDAIAANDLPRFAHLLQNPAETVLFHGFDDLMRGRQKTIEQTPETLHSLGQVIHERLQKVAEGVGAICLQNPEDKKPYRMNPVEDLLVAIDHAVGFRVTFPNPFAWEYGVVTSRGVASYRAVQALYQSWKTKQIIDAVAGTRVLEIGAGLGRNTFFCRHMGIRDYTIIDIPTTQLAQGYYIGRVLGADSVALNGEEKSREVRLRSPGWLSQTDERFDVIVNFDSMTEMDRQHADGYASFALNRSKAFLSINHEINGFTVRDVFARFGAKPTNRSEYMARPGYVEEVFMLELDRLRSAHSTLEGEIRELRNSTSWKATAPARYINTKLKQLGQLP